MPAVDEASKATCKTMNAYTIHETPTNACIQQANSEAIHIDR